MNNNDSQEKLVADLRQRAEEIIRKQAAQSPASETISSEEIRKILHELCVHQIELEMQNDELRQSNLELHASQARYFELYDLAPAGYCTISEQGMILEANLAAPALLGMGRNELVKQPFSRFILKADQDIYSLCRQQLMEKGEPQACELRMLKKDGTAFWVHLAISVAQDTRGNSEVRAELSDITERKHAEEALVDLASQWQNTFDAVSDGVCLLDIDQHIVRCNKAMSDLFSKSSTDMIGKTCWEVMHGTKEPILECPIKKMGKTLRRESMELKIADRWFEVTVDPFFDADKKLAGVVHIIRDITDCTLMVDALRESEEKYRLLFENAGDTIFIHDSDGLILAVNQMAISQLGYTQSELMHMNIKQVDSPDQSKHVPERIARLIEHGFLSFETVHQRKDGSLIPTHVSARQIVWNGNPATMSICRDITERKQAEEKIMFRNLLLSIQQEASLDGILVVDDNNNIRWNNHHFVEIMNIPQELIENKIDEPILQLVTEQMADPQQFLRRVQYLYEHRREISREELVLKDGRILDRYSSPMYGSDDHYYGRCWYFRDITELKRAAKEIKLKNEELQKANAEKDKFFSIIAHDLRSPFQSFLGLTKEMAEEFSRLTKDEIREIAVGMRDSAANLFRLIESLLQWSIMQQGLMHFNPKAVLLLPIVNESVAMVLEPARNKGIEITSHIPDDIKVLADSNMLQSVIRNLVSNAVKFTAKGGSINLSAKSAGDNNVEISIKDSGIGMSSKMVDNLFRVDVRTKRKGTEGEPSTGLGLLLCKEFVEKQGGKIRVESEEGKGSVFYFTIPSSTALGKENVIKDVVTADETETQIKPLKILIAEDDEISESLITIMVKKFGKEVLKVRTGVEAVEACRNNPDIDLVLMDIEMQEMDGYEATRQIRQFNKDAVIIAQTAYSLAGEKEKAIAAGCNDYIAKPYNETSLMKLLKSICKEKK